jgi:DNA-binding protein H-NS
MALVEALVNVTVGFLVSVLAQLAVFPFFGLTAGLTDNFLISAIFTAASIARNYLLRRLFETIARILALRHFTGADRK